MKSFIVKRGPDTQSFDQMIKIHDWCEMAFGKMDYLRWNLNFARGTENYVEFDFRREEDASAFVLQWNDDCISKETQFMLGIASWDEV